MDVSAAFREKLKVVKPTGEANDGPEAKKAKVDPTETTMVKKVRLSLPFNPAWSYSTQR